MELDRLRRLAAGSAPQPLGDQLQIAIGAMGIEGLKGPGVLGTAGAPDHEIGPPTQLRIHDRSHENEIGTYSVGRQGQRSYRAGWAPLHLKLLAAVRGEAMDGFYIGYFTGTQGTSLGVFVFREGVIVGADVGGGAYDGSYTLSPDGQHIVGTVNMNIGPNNQLITGLISGAQPVRFPVPIQLPVAFSEEAVFRIETPAGPVNAKFKKVRGL